MVFQYRLSGRCIHMQQTNSQQLQPSSAELLPLSWHAKLELEYQKIGERSTPVLRRRSGPLHLQKHFYPEGPEVCQHIILHPPGGIAGGDKLDIQVHCGPDAWAQITSPGAAKWYTSDRPAYQNLTLTADAGGTIEWLPQETIFYPSCNAELDTTINLAKGANVITWDIVVLGLPGSGKFFDSGYVRQRLKLKYNDRLLWSERTQLQGGSQLLKSPVGFDNYAVAGTFLVSGELNGEQLAACRSLSIEEGKGGLTQLPGLVVARFLGMEAEAARNWFIALWHEMRPALTGRPVSFPRIWNT